MVLEIFRKAYPCSNSYIGHHQSTSSLPISGLWGIPLASSIAIASWLPEESCAVQSNCLLLVWSANLRTKCLWNWPCYRQVKVFLGCHIYYCIHWSLYIACNQSVKLSCKNVCWSNRNTLPEITTMARVCSSLLFQYTSAVANWMKNTDWKKNSKPLTICCLAMSFLHTIAILVLGDRRMTLVLTVSGYCH